MGFNFMEQPVSTVDVLHGNSEWRDNEEKGVYNHKILVPKTTKKKG